MDTATLTTISNIFVLFSAMVQFMAPLITIFGIMETKTTEGFSGFPYLLTLLSCVVTGWWNAIPSFSSFLILGLNPELIFVNAFGAVIHVFYVLVFVKYTNQAVKKAILVSVSVVLYAAFLAFTLVSRLAFTVEKQRVIYGYASDICTIAMYGAPFTVVVKIIENRNVQYMPLAPSVALFVRSIFSLLSAVLNNDQFVAISNVIGFVLVVAQLILHCIFRCNIQQNADNNNDHQNAENNNVNQANNNDQGQGQDVEMVINGEV